MNRQALESMAKKLRFEAVRMIYESKDGHPGPALSCADIVTALYFDIMRLDPANPSWEDRDRFILSKGHACPIWYAALNEKGYNGEKVENFHLRACNSCFQGHPVKDKTPGVDMTAGSLGNGIAIGVGMACAARYLQKDYYTYVITGDGELQEGVIWEGVNAAVAQKLDNIIVYVDKNGWQSAGRVEALMENNVRERFAAFGWHTQEIDGHDMQAILDATAAARKEKGRPSVVVCNTVKGKGLSFMEDDNTWHKGVPTDEQYALAAAELAGV